MTSVRRALALSFAERYLSIMLALGSNIILARLLTPAEIGMYSVTLAVIGIAQVLRDFGIGNYLIQLKEPSPSQISTAFGMSLLLGGSLFVVVYLLAPWAAAFYNEADMTATMRIASLNFLVLPFCLVPMSLLRRDMQFKRLLYVSLGASIVNFGVTVALAWAGWGANSMAIGSVAMNAATAVGTLLVGERRAICWPSLTHWRPVLSFGGQSAATSVITTISMDANDLVVGKVLGFEPVAMISRAQGLISLFHRDVMGAIRNVALPAYSNAHRAHEPMAPVVAHSASMVTIVGWTFYGWIGLFSLEAIRLLYGTQWDAAAGLVPLLALAGAISCISTLMPSALIAVGRIDLVTKIDLTLQPLKLALVVVAAVVFKSMTAVVAALLLMSILASPVFSWATNRAIGGLFPALIRGLGDSLAVALTALAPAVILVLWSGVDRKEPIHLAAVLASVLAGLVLGLLAADIVRHSITRERLYMTYRSKLLSVTLRKSGANPGEKP
jgi:O-antigen/teichoic acid export membrane protein